MIKVSGVPAFKDNYIWILVHSESRRCVIVDPGDATPVIDYIEKHQLLPHAILITHHHFDHTGGLLQLRDLFKMKAYGPANEAIEGIDEPLLDQSTVDFPELGLRFGVMAIPGHTQGHIAYYGDNRLLCGDTLFSAGCGRLFEGTANEMYTSLQKIAALPDTTLVYCAHEYTLANLDFAKHVEPNNPDIQHYRTIATDLRTNFHPTLPSTLEQEKKVNPFLRCQQPAIIQAAEQHAGKKLSTPVQVFETLRAWKNTF